MKCYVYILYSKSADKFYVGVSNDVYKRPQAVRSLQLRNSVNIFFLGATNDLDDRLRRHNSGLENYTQKHKPWTLFWFTKKPNKSEAFKLEQKLRNL